MLKTPDNVRHIIIKVRGNDKIFILGDVIVKYGGMENPTIMFADTKKEANDIYLNANLKMSC